MANLVQELQALVIVDDITRHQWENVIELAERLEQPELTAIPSERLRGRVVRLVKHADGIGVYIGGTLRLTIL